jgi:hypothetical protein
VLSESVVGLLGGCLMMGRGADTSLLGLGHSYYADNRTIISDLFYLLRGHGPRERASLQQRKHRKDQLRVFAA